MSLLTDEPRPLDARAVQDVELVVLTRDVMRPMFVEDPAVAEHLSQALTRHLAKSKEAIEHCPASSPRPSIRATLLSSIRRVFGLANLPR